MCVRGMGACVFAFACACVHGCAHAGACMHLLVTSQQSPHPCFSLCTLVSIWPALALSVNLFAFPSPCTFPSHSLSAHVDGPWRIDRCGQVAGIAEAEAQYLYWVAPTLPSSAISFITDRPLHHPDAEIWQKAPYSYRLVWCFHWLYRESSRQLRQQGAMQGALRCGW